MKRNLDHFFNVLREHIEDYEILRRNAADPIADKNGLASSLLAGNRRFVGIASFLLHGDGALFRTELAESAKLQIRIFQRFVDGEPVDGSLVTMLSYKHLFDALAAHDMETARVLASHMGGRDASERKHDHPFDYAMGYTLRAFVLRDTSQMQQWPEKLIVACSKSRMSDFEPYGELFQAMRANDSCAGNDAMIRLEKGHRKQSIGKGVFAGIADEAISVWGIGMANLSRQFGLRVEAIPPLIPEALLC